MAADETEAHLRKSAKSADLNSPHSVFCPWSGGGALRLPGDEALDEVVLEDALGFSVGAEAVEFAER